MRLVFLMTALLLSNFAYAANNWVLQPDFSTKIVQGFSGGGIRIPSSRVDGFISQSEDQCAQNYNNYYPRRDEHKLAYNLIANITNGPTPDTKLVSTSCQYMVVLY